MTDYPYWQGHFRPLGLWFQEPRPPCAKSQSCNSPSRQWAIPKRKGQRSERGTSAPCNKWKLPKLHQNCTKTALFKDSQTVPPTLQQRVKMPSECVKSAWLLWRKENASNRSGIVFFVLRESQDSGLTKENRSFRNVKQEKQQLEQTVRILHWPYLESKSMG